jgi:hypothetical protein
LFALALSPVLLQAAGGDWVDENYPITHWLGQPGETLWAIYIIDPGMKQRIATPVNVLIGQTTVRPYRLG